jgi:hypothetical protein
VKIRNNIIPTNTIKEEIKANKEVLPIIRDGSDKWA